MFIELKNLENHSKKFLVNIGEIKSIHIKARNAYVVYGSGVSSYFDTTVEEAEKLVNYLEKNKLVAKVMEDF